MRLRLPDLGESLRTAAIDLAADLTLDRVDCFLSRIEGARTSVQHLRLALATKRAEGAA
jgi:hypothetical protein